MGSAGSTPEVSAEDVLEIFARSDRPSTPRTAAEVADELDCHRDAARDALEALADDGPLHAKEIADAARVWWATDRLDTDESEGDGRAESDRLAAFIDAVTEYAIFMLDPDGRVVSWNDGAERIKGYEEEEIIGEHFSTFYTDADTADGVPEANLQAAATKGRVEDEGWRVRADGSEFWADVVITAIRDDDGALRGFTKVTRDLTERREYEQQLERERDLIEQIFDTVPVSITVLTPESEFRRANPRALERLGIGEDELDEHTADSWDLYDEDGEPIPSDATPWSNAAEIGEPIYDFECRADLPEIGRRWLSINAAPIERDDAADDRVVLSVEDITERKARERDLRRERNQTRELLRTAPVAIVVDDAEGDTLLANRRAQEHLGLSESEIVDETDGEQLQIYDSEGDALDPDDTPSARVRDTGEPAFEEEIAIEYPDGTRTWFSVSAAPVFGPDGELDRVVSAAEDITPIKRRERQLERRKRELETELHEVFDRISDAFYALDEEWRFTHVNDRAEELLEQSREELLERRLWDAYPAATDSIIWDRFHEAMDTQEPVNFEVTYGEDPTWLEVNAYPSETGMSVYFRDVTDRKERERELERYRNIVETVNDGIYTVDRDGRFSMVNETYAEMTGYSREELLGSHVSLVVDEPVTESARELERDLLDGDRDKITLEAELQRADGDTLPAEAAFSLLPSDEDEYERVGIVRDISERKAQERALEESERRYRTLVENFPNGVVALFDEDLQYTAAGGELLEELGINRDEAIGTPIRERYPDDVAAEIEPNFRDALEGEKSTFELEYYGRNLLAHTLPIRNADDEIYAGMLVVQDVTERRKYRRQLEETIEDLEASNERLEQFAYIASHDLQEPLRMVTSYLELLETRYGDELDEDAEEFIDYAVDGAERMRAMVNDLLAYSRLDSEAEPLEPTDPERVVDRVLDQLQVQLAETDAEVVVDDLPTVLADDNQLEQVFQNLVSNAIKYRDDEPPRIEIDAEPRGGAVEFRVEDNGIGMDPAKTDQIFEIFKRLHSRDEYPGTGIGLALCQKIVRRHDGEIRVDSEPGEGSTFYFTLPPPDEESE